MYFPDLSAAVLAERYTYMAIVKKSLCAGVAGAIAQCDPVRCQKGLDGAVTRPQLYTAARKLWEGYYQDTFGRGDELAEEYAALLDQLDWGDV